MEDYVFRDVLNRKIITLRAIDSEMLPTCNIHEECNCCCGALDGYLRHFVLEFGHIREKYVVTIDSTQVHKFDAFLGHTVIKIVEELLY